MLPKTTAKTIKRKKCPCGLYFHPRNTFQSACCTAGALILVEKAKAKKLKADAKREREEFRQRKLDSKKMSYWLARTQKAVNELRRCLDKDKPCYTCGTYETVQWEAGHYRSRGACSSARFDWERNIRTTCHHCNVNLSGNQGQFRVELAAEIGEAKVLALEAMPKSYRWSRQECEAIERDAKARLKVLKQA